jgi:hypothetical protein
MPHEWIKSSLDEFSVRVVHSQRWLRRLAPRHDTMTQVADIMASAEKPSHLRLCHIAIEKWYNLPMRVALGTDGICQMKGIEDFAEG